jgi:dihydroorotase-like cyclic amidohydrolase
MDQLYSKVKDTGRAFDGLELTGWPIVTIVSGDIVMQDGDVYEKAHEPKYVRPDRKLID